MKQGEKVNKLERSLPCLDEKRKVGSSASSLRRLALPWRLSVHFKGQNAAQNRLNIAPAPIIL